MADFDRWSAWLESAFETDAGALAKADPDVLAVMAWIATRASADGSGWSFDHEAGEWLGRVLGIGGDRVRRAMLFLEERELINAAPGGDRMMLAVLPKRDKKPKTPTAPSGDPVPF